MLPDQVSNPGPLTYESGALPIAPGGPACELSENCGNPTTRTTGTDIAELHPIQEISFFMYSDTYGIG